MAVGRAGRCRVRGVGLSRRDSRHPEHRPDRRELVCENRWHTTALCSPTRSCLRPCQLRTGRIAAGGAVPPMTSGTKGPPIDLGIGPVDVLVVGFPGNELQRSNPGTPATSWTCTHARPAAGSVPRTGPPTDMRFTLGRCARLSSGGRGLHPRASHLRLPPGLFGRGVTASATNYSARVCLSLSTAASGRHMTSTARNGTAFTLGDR